MRSPSLSLARAIADAVLYEGYLLYPYRASSQKNQARWQFGILGPPGAAESGAGEESGLFADALLRAGPLAEVAVHLRFLQLQTRTVERADATGFIPVPELSAGSARWLTWDEAIEHEVPLGPFSLAQLREGPSVAVEIPDGEDAELLRDPSGSAVGRLVRRRRALRATVTLTMDSAGTDYTGADQAGAAGAGDAPLLRLRVAVDNTAAGQTRDKHDAIAQSFIGTHVLLSLVDGDFISLLDPPDGARAAAQACTQHRGWPVLAGPPGQSDVLLISPIILYDHPAVAPESSVALYDSTEIDEILTLRVLTLTEEEKAEARATDPRAAEIIDRCEAMTETELQALHGILRNPHAGEDLGSQATAPPFEVLAEEPPAGTPWWDPAADSSVRPESDVVVIKGVPVARGSRVVVMPSRRADAQDLFSAGQPARVTGVHFDVDGSTHVAVVIEADPAAELQEWYGRYLYFSPEELEPLDPLPAADDGRKGPQ
ncbi:hypothetical protein ACQCSX_05720 [Pseudarthrobacter sp. P1]|uniref:hypothetical protein n=1 Tax=Pseudarthrobacter sp. P1 TaxID=3418418 RepID=UPI003CF43F6B